MSAGGSEIGENAPVGFGLTGAHTVVRNDAESRYELDCPGGPAVAVFAREGETLVFTHTVVPPEAEGHGVGSKLTAGALADVRARGERVVAQCPFVAAYVERHPEERDLLA